MEEMNESQIIPFVTYSCYDDDLNATGVTRERWVTTDREGGLATAIVLIVYVLLGLPLNLLIICSMLWKKLYVLPAHILLLNLALNDLLMCAYYLPINIVSGIAGEFIFGGNDVTRCHVCKTGVTFVIFSHFNIHVISLLSLDRFLFIKLPLRYKSWVTVKTTVVAVVITWIWSVALSLPLLFEFGEIRFTDPISTCTIFLLDKTDLVDNIYYEVFSIIEAFLLPIPMLLVTNIWLLCIVQKQLKKIYKTRRTMESQGNLSKYDQALHKKMNNTKNRKQLRLVKIFGVILVANIITWVPNVINTTLLFAFLWKPFFVPNYVFITNYLLFLSQVLVHPLLQALLIPEIRHTLVKALYLDRCSRKTRKDLQRMNSSMSMPEEKGCCSCLCCEMCAVAILPRTGTTVTNISMNATNPASFNRSRSITSP